MLAANGRFGATAAGSGGLKVCGGMSPLRQAATTLCVMPEDSVADKETKK
jgi:hypothetical protein